MRSNKGIGLIEATLLLTVIMILLLCLFKGEGSDVEADADKENYESITARIDSNIDTLTTESREEPDYIYLSANYGPEAGVVKKISLKDSEEEGTTEGSPELEQKGIESMQKEPEYEPPANLYNLTLEEQYLLTALAYCEAGGEDIEGQALVINVVLNRVADDRFPDNIHDVVFQEGQFTPAMNGTLAVTAGSDESWGALDMVNMEGWDESQGALYFCATWCDVNWGGYLFTHGGHKFYR